MTSWTDVVRATMDRTGHGERTEAIVEELAQHAEDAFAEARSRGADEAAANDRVRALVESWCAQLPARAGVPHAAPPVPPPAQSRGAGGLLQDVRFAWRLLARHRGFALGAGATMALGIAVTTLIFSVVRGVLVRPLPWPQSEQLVRLSETAGPQARSLGPLLSNATYLAWSERHQTLSGLGAYFSAPATMSVGDAAPRRVRTAAATASLFSLLRVRPLLGRVLAAEDDRMDAPCAVLLAESAWRRDLGGRRAAIGSVVRLDARSCTVVGVLPAGFRFPDVETEVWQSLPVTPVAVPGGGQAVTLMDAIGRLAPGATAAQAAAEGTARAAAGPSLGMTGVAVFGSDAPRHVVAEPLLAAWTGDVRRPLLLLLAAAALLLAGAVANVAGIQLARALTRRREIALRAAIGAGAPRIARQLLVENVLHGLLAGGAGLLLAWALERALPWLLPVDFPRLDAVRLDLQVAAFAIALAVACGLLMAVLPVWMARRAGVRAALGEGGPLRLGRVQLSAGGGRALIMAAQVTIAVVLLVGAGLLARSFRAQWNLDRGFDPRNLLTAALPMPEASFSKEARQVVSERLVERLSGLPQVHAAAVTNALPLVPGDAMLAFAMPQPGGGAPRRVHASVRAVTGHYFDALGLRIREGRALQPGDGGAAPRVVVVNRAFARAYLGARPLDARLPMRYDNQQPIEWQVVGVVDDVRVHSADEPLPEIFVDARQIPDHFEASDVILVARTTGDPRLLVPEVRALVHEEAPGVALDAIRTMEERLSASLARPRLYALLLGVFAAMGLLVTGVGLFGVLSYTVAQRTRELGIRSALGASPAAVVRLVLAQSLAITACGLAAGVVVAMLARGAVARLLIGVGALDPLTYAAAALLLLLVTAAASVVPALRAARLHPVRALST